MNSNKNLRAQLRHSIHQLEPVYRIWLVIDSVNIAGRFIVDVGRRLTASWRTRDSRTLSVLRTIWPIQMSGLILPRKLEGLQAGAENLGGELAPVFIFQRLKVALPKANRHWAGSVTLQHSLSSLSVWHREEACVPLPHEILNQEHDEESPLFLGVAGQSGPGHLGDLGVGVRLCTRVMLLETHRMCDIIGSPLNWGNSLKTRVVQTGYR